MELPCPSPPTLHGDEFLSWFRSPATGLSTALVAHVQVARPAPDPGKPGRESRLKLLGNNSLWLEGSKEGDAGRYWCAVLGQHHRYQNWRVYDVSVLRASMDASPALCAPSTEWGAPWILMLLLTVGQGFTIVVLSVMLWRRRVQGTKHRREEGDASFPQFKPEIQVYENIHLAHLRLVEEVGSPGEAGHEDERGDEEEAGGPMRWGGRIAQVLLTAVVLRSVGA
ncbi:Lymphocyte antigen 6 complex locus protein G6f, partial [Eschrichtius robustus]|nr:Lymphocyte antigen 6 complex locus protein G6f [Eschrichtius robustus]